MKAFCRTSCEWLTVAAIVCGPAVCALAADPTDQSPASGVDRIIELQFQAAQGAADKVQAQAKAIAVGPRYRLGVALGGVSDATRAQLGLKPGEGVLIQGVEPDSPAAKAGVEQYDILLSASGKPLLGPAGLLQVVQGSDGKEIEFEVLRQGKRTTLKVAPVKQEAPAISVDVDALKLHQEARDLLEKLEQNHGGQMRLRMIQPGVIIPPELELNELPDGLKVKVLREKGEPAKVIIQQGDETWEATEKDLDKLPQKFRKMAGGLLSRLGRKPDSIALQAIPGPAVDDDVRIRRFPFSGNRDLEKRLTEMQEQLDALRKQVDELQAEPGEKRPRRNKDKNDKAA
jgi:membrane-associated protease RseP (regulator of RpoE activity)